VSVPCNPDLPKGQTFAVTDGRDAVGTIRAAGGTFTAINTAGEIVGTFDTLIATSRAFTNGGAR
jgi:hypothetical protein